MLPEGHAVDPGEARAHTNRSPSGTLPTEICLDLDLDQLADTVLRLPVAARAELATRLLESLDAHDANESPELIAAVWEAELDRREAELAANPSLAIPAEEVFRRIESDLAARRAARTDTKP